MKFTCQKIDLQNLLRDAWVVASRARSYNNWFLMESDETDPGVRFKSSSHSAYYCRSLNSDIRVERHGQLRVFAPSFKAIIDSIASSPSDTVTIFKDDSGSVKITSGSSKFEIGCTDPMSFPKMKGVDAFHEVQIWSEPFRALVKRVSYIRSPIVPVVELMFGGGKLRACATDGVRLAMDSIDIDSDINDKIYLSNESLDVLSDLANSKDGKFTLGWNDSDIILKHDGTYAEVHRNTTPFPDADNLFKILAVNPLIARVDTSELSTVLKSLSIFHDDANLVPLNMFFDSDKLKVSITNKEAGKGSGEWEMHCQFSGGGPFGIRFNLRFIKEFTSGILGSEMTIKMKDKSTPVLIELSEAGNRYKRESCENMKMMLSPIG